MKKNTIDLENSLSEELKNLDIQNDSPKKEKEFEIQITNIKEDEKKGKSKINIKEKCKKWIHKIKSENFEILIGKFEKYSHYFDNSPTLTFLVDLMFEKALEDSYYSQLVVEMLAQMIRFFPTLIPNGDNKIHNLNRITLNKCQIEFEDFFEVIKKDENLQKKKKR